ncbi:MAG: hypothetical protein V3W41_22115 [Planctomycetota bacterium]
MARIIEQTLTALVGNTDLEARFHFEGPDDPENPTIADMKMSLKIRWDNGTYAIGIVKVSDVLSGSELTDFRSALVTLRDAAFDAAGIPDV